MSSHSKAVGPQVPSAPGKARGRRTDGAGAGTRVGGFVLRLVFYWSAGFLLVGLVPAVERVTIQATLASLLPSMSLLFSGVSRAGDLVHAAGATVKIVPECTSLIPMVILFGAMVAFPASARARVLGVVAGSVILWIYNLVRIMVLIAVLARFPAWFDLAHVYLWQSTTIILLAGLFVLWLRYADARESS